MKLSQKEEKLAKLIRKLQIKGLTKDILIFLENYIGNGHKVVSFDVHNDSFMSPNIMQYNSVDDSGDFYQYFLSIKLFMC